MELKKASSSILQMICLERAGFRVPGKTLSYQLARNRQGMTVHAASTTITGGKEWDFMKEDRFPLLLHFRQKTYL
jgi:hypothetical protein